MGTERLLLGSGLALLLAAGCTDRSEAVDSGPVGTDTGTEATVGTEGEVRINEVAAQNGDFVEVLVPGTEAVDLSGWTLVHEGRAAWTFPAGAVVQPGRHVPLRALGGAGIVLGREGSLRLVDRAGQERDATTWPAGAARTSWGRHEDGVGDFAVLAEATPGEANAAPAEAVLLSPLWVADEPGGVSDALVDSLGRIWLTVPAQGEIVALDGTSLEVLGRAGDLSDFPADEAGNQGPDGLALLPDGRLLVGDTGGGRLLVLDPATLSLSPWLPLHGLDRPGGVAVGDDGSVLVSDRDQHRVWHYRGDGALLRTYGPVGEGTEAVPRYPGQVALWGDVMAVASPLTPAVVLFDLQSGALLGTVGAAQEGSEPEPGRFATWSGGVAWDPEAGLLLATDRGNGRVLLYDANDLERLLDPDQDWGYLGAFGRPGDAAGELLLPVGLALAPERGLLVVTEHERRAQGFDLAEVRSLAAGR